jgi:hypothetical protein
MIEIEFAGIDNGRGVTGCQRILVEKRQSVPTLAPCFIFKDFFDTANLVQYIY